MNRRIQGLRYGARFGVLGILLLAPLLARHRVLATRGQMNALRAQTPRTWSAAVMVKLDDWLGAPRAAAIQAAGASSEGKTHRPLRLKGNVWSAELFGVSLTDPLGGVESVAAGHAGSAAVWIGLTIPVLATVLLGRVFCSWICPAGLLFELADKLRGRNGGLPETVPRPLWRGHKYVLLTVGLGVSFVAGLPLLSLFYPPAVLGREVSRMVLGFLPGLGEGLARGGLLVLTGGAVFLLALVVIELFGWRRAWCARLCPGGALYSLLGARRLLRLRNDRVACTRCRDCVPACPMGLNPMNNEFGPECDNCLVCRTACAPGSIRFAPPWWRGADAPSGMPAENPRPRKVA